MAECFAFAPARTAEWDRTRGTESWDKRRDFRALLAEIWEWPEEVADATCVPTTHEQVERCFNKLVAEWESDTSSVSSLSALVRHPKYREIVDLGWPVVGFLLRDLRDNRRFWFSALQEITTAKPYHGRDERDFDRMRDAWLLWGMKEGLL